MNTAHPETGVFAGKPGVDGPMIDCRICGKHAKKAYRRTMCEECNVLRARRQNAEYKAKNPMPPGRPVALKGWDKDLSLSMLSRKL